ncbi:MAG: tetratricopeptide repeat protein [Deltaproteobacteria bacterium]|nr:tetratricopeptide repeat protein [Candidatus Zymogenaceae bacterium]
MHIRSFKTIFVFTCILALCASACLGAMTTDELKDRVIEIEEAYLDGSVDQVITKYDRLSEDNPDDADYRYLLGIAYLYSEFDLEGATFDAAFDELFRAKELNPTMKHVNYTLGYIYWARGEFESAIEAYRAEIELDPEDGWNYFNLGQAYESLKEWDKARSQYILAIDKDPAIADAYNNLGAIELNWRGDYFSALEAFEKALALRPEEKLYMINYNEAVKKLKSLRDSLDQGEVTLPSDQVEKLKDMELEELEIEGYTDADEGTE